MTSRGTQLFCTMDVVGLYLHTPHEEGLKNMKEVIEEFGKNCELKLPVEDLVDLTRLILKRYYPEFDSKIFKQKLGTAIGTKFAHSFLNILLKLVRVMLNGY